MARVTAQARSFSPRGQIVSLKVEGIQQAQRIPAGLQESWELMLRDIELALVASFKSFVPGRPDGRLGRQVVAHRLSRNQIIVGTFGSKFAKALNRGFTSKPQKGKALRFDDGGYSKYAHVEGKHFFEKALAAAPPIVDAAYIRFFNDPRQHSGGVGGGRFF